MPQKKARRGTPPINSPKQARPLSLTAIQTAVSDKGESWTAGETTLTALSVAEQRAHLGLVVNPAELKATALAINAAEKLVSFRAVAAPAAIDWRNNGGNFVTSIKDQLSCGSCVSFATVATIESRIRIACKNANLNVDLSEAQLFYCGCGNCCGTGWNFAPALDFAKNTGLVIDSAFPYTPGNQPCKPSLPAPYAKLTAWQQVLAVADRKNVLATKGPVVAGFEVFQDFYAYKTGVYKHVTGVSEGYHAVSVVGYDDAQGCWICKNSWGPGWGDNGFFRIAYGECLIDTQFAFYDPDVNCPVPTSGCEEYLAQLRRILLEARRNPQLRAALRFYVCHRGSLPWWTPAQYRKLAQQVAAVLRRCPKYVPWFCTQLG